MDSVLSHSSADHRWPRGRQSDQLCHSKVIFQVQLGSYLCVSRTPCRRLSVAQKKTRGQWSAAGGVCGDGVVKSCAAIVVLRVSTEGLAGPAQIMCKKPCEKAVEIHYFPAGWFLLFSQVVREPRRLYCYHYGVREKFTTFTLWPIVPVLATSASALLLTPAVSVLTSLPLTR